MLPLRKVSGALHQSSQHVQHRRRVALRGRRLAGRQSDLALRHGESRQRVDDEQHILSLAGEILRDRRCRKRSTNAQQRRLVGSGNNHHRTPQTLFAEHLKKLADFASAFADQRQHRHVGRGAARHHADQRALAHAAAAEDADTLAASAGDESHRWRECRSSSGSRIGTRSSGSGADPSRVHGMDGAILAFAVERIARGIDDAAQHARARRESMGARPRSRSGRRSECPAADRRPWKASSIRESR